MIDDTENKQVYSKKQNTFLYGLIDMPRYPWVHIAALLLIGAWSLAYQIVKLSPELLENSKILDEEVHTFPSMVCLTIVFYMHITILLRRIVKDLKNVPMGSDFVVTDEEAEELAENILWSWIGLLLMFIRLVIFATICMTSAYFMVQLYIII